MTASVPTPSAERMVEVGTAASAIALSMAVLRYGIPAYVGRYPELFVGVIGGIWCGIAGSLIALAVTTYLGALAVYIAEFAKQFMERQ